MMGAVMGACGVLHRHSAAIDLARRPAGWCRGFRRKKKQLSEQIKNIFVSH